MNSNKSLVDHAYDELIFLFIFSKWFYVSLLTFALRDEMYYDTPLKVIHNYQWKQKQHVAYIGSPGLQVKGAIENSYCKKNTTSFKKIK